MHRKPSGDIGPLEATVKNGGVEAHWNRIRFPPDKVGQEQYITRLLVDALKRQENQIFDIEKLPESDHDALLKHADIEIELQLMEIVIRPKKELPYRDAPRNFNSGKFADHIIEKIKTKHYAAGRRPLWFLLYSTHWAFVPPHSVLYLFHNYFETNKHPYARAFVAELCDSTFADVTDIYPELNGTKIRVFPPLPSVAVARRQDYRLADPSTGSVAGGAISIKI